MCLHQKKAVPKADDDKQVGNEESRFCMLVHGNTKLNGKSSEDVPHESLCLETAALTHLLVSSFLTVIGTKRARGCDGEEKNSEGDVML